MFNQKVGEGMKKIFVVDDNKAVLRLFKAVAHKAKARGLAVQLEVAKDLAEAEDKAKNFGKGLYVLDMDLGNGQLSAPLLRLPEVRENFIIFTAAENFDEIRAKFEEKHSFFRGKINNKGDPVVFKGILNALFDDYGKLIIADDKFGGAIHAPEENLMLHVYNDDALIELANKVEEQPPLISIVQLLNMDGLLTKLREQHCKNPIKEVLVLGSNIKAGKDLLDALARQGIVAKDYKILKEEDEKDAFIHVTGVPTFLYNLDDSIKNFVGKIQHNRLIYNADEIVDEYVEVIKDL